MARLDKNTLSEYESTLEACKQEIDSLHDRTSVVETLVSEIIYDKCKDIDNLIQQIKEAVYDVDSIADYQLDIFIAKIPIQLYYLSSVMSSFQTSESVAKLSQKVAYNDARMKAEGTVADADVASLRHGSIGGQASEDTRRDVELMEGGVGHPDVVPHVASLLRGMDEAELLCHELGVVDACHAAVVDADVVDGRDPVVCLVHHDDARRQHDGGVDQFEAVDGTVVACRALAHAEEVGLAATAVVRDVLLHVDILHGEVVYVRVGAHLEASLTDVECRVLARFGKQGDALGQGDGAGLAVGSPFLVQVVVHSVLQAEDQFAQRSVLHACLDARIEVGTVGHTDGTCGHASGAEPADVVVFSPFGSLAVGQCHVVDRVGRQSAEAVAAGSDIGG